MPFISLNRVFLPWSEEDGAAAELYAVYGSQQEGYDWEKLRAKPRVIILAEAGSGKTQELKEQARLQSDAGKFAFYATVQDISRDGLDNALDNGKRHALQAWRESDQPAWFFIDSIDEAKLEGFRLDTALRKIADGIERAPARAHVILSGRITDWEFRADLSRFEKLLPIAVNRTTPAPPSSDGVLVQALRGEFRHKKKEEAEKAIVVLMGVLDEARVRIFAGANGINYLDDFIAGIEAIDLWTFARQITS
jgi:hypothetical protein